MYKVMVILMMTLMSLMNYWVGDYKKEEANTQVNFLLSILHVKNLVIL